ncbi:MAG: lamin tail domain-containing protein [Bacteroidales bacterium]|nr:lamin tail domain-containing protein [Bacteroidales bacterium]
MTIMLIVSCTIHGQGTLLISEILFQPHSGEAEYVELYNNSNAAVELSDYQIVRWIGDSLGTRYPLPLHTVAAHDYVALTKDVASVTANYDVKYPSKLLMCNLPTYPNSGGSVILCSSDSTIIDRFNYSPAMHSRLLRNKGGVALERRSFDRPTNDLANWFSASSLSGYGTPGYENSQSAEFLVEESAFVFSSTLISPDGDEYQDVLEIDYTMDNEELLARAEVFDVRGSMVCHLLNNALLGTHGTITWDGRNDNRQTLPQGQYIVRITVYNIEGTQQKISRVIALLTH